MRLMRKTERQTDDETAMELLQNGVYGVLSLIDADGLPYGVPMSYACDDGRIYLHCATEGRKLDGLRKNPAVSFCVVGQTELLPEKFSTRYESVVATGRASELHGADKEEALMVLVRKLSPEHLEKGAQYVHAAAHQACAFVIDIENLTGKARR